MMKNTFGACSVLISYFIKKDDALIRFSRYAESDQAVPLTLYITIIQGSMKEIGLQTFQPISRSHLSVSESLGLIWIVGR
jgi:hypothetical protein